MDALAQSTSFEGRAEILLDHLAAVLRMRISDAGLLRGAVHVRPDGDYEALVWRSWVDREHALKTSMTAWKGIQHRRSALWIDVESGHFRSLAKDEWTEDRHDEAGFQDTHQHLIESEVTHLLALPLMLPGELRGMVTLELEWLDQVGRAVAWEAWGDLLQGMVDLGALFLRDVPHRSGPISGEDLPYPHLGQLMLSRLRLMRVFAQDPRLPLILRGETGTGKTTLARWCHEQSSRRDGPCIDASLNSFPSDLVYARLFGARRGSFTGAEFEQDGLVKLADGGTLIIDEVDKLPENVQLGLLRFLESGAYRPVGAITEQTADVRVIACTNIQKNGLREDFFHRLGGYPIDVPPLRERTDELPRWALSFAQEKANELEPGRQVRITESATQRLLAASWPGNLRELQKLMERACLLARGPTGDIVIDEEPLVMAWNPASSSSSLLQHYRHLGRQLLGTLQQRGNTEQAPLNLKVHGDVLVGQVVLLAEDGGVDWGALAQLGDLQSLRKSSNHLAYFRQCVTALQDLYRSLSETPPAMPASLVPRRRL